MGGENYFQSALSNFIFEFACGGAIRKLAGQGYTSKQIADRLSFPVSYGRVREAVTDYLLEEGILLRQEPAEGRAQERYVYVQDHGEYGRVSFRKVPLRGEQTDPAGPWTQRCVTAGELLDRLRKCDGRPAQEKLYTSCDFGGKGLGPEVFAALNERQQEYLQGIRWDRKRMYHLLNGRMMEIVIRLCERDSFCGKVYFETAREVLVVERAV